jgi:adenosylcobinamide-GDP ribazoletransferase
VMRPLLCAVSFLTRIPVPASVHTATGDLGRSARYFPLIGLLLGAIYAGAAVLLCRAFSVLVAAVLITAIDALLTGALHLDGLADMADGFGAGRRREDILRIMRDHAIGSYGAVALVLALFLKTVCISDLLTSHEARKILLITPTLSRWGIVLLSRSAPYAQAIEGTGALVKLVSPADLFIATVICVPLPFLFGVTRTLASWLTVAVITALMSRLCRSRIGGVTGDTLGANLVITELGQFMVALLPNPHG